MIIIKFYRDNQGKILAYEGSGHSNCGKEGEDIVCAGISAILQTTFLGLKNYLNIPIKYKQKKGSFYCEILETGKVEKEALAILQTMILGIEEIAKLHPKNVKIEWVTI